MKLFVGPMSKNVVDATIEFVKETPNSDLCGFIPSRRQIETRHLGPGYVNNWTTEEFSWYLKRARCKLPIKRDHAGPGQGSKDDDGTLSLASDINAGVTYIHVDPWKKYKDVEDAANVTAELLDYCFELNSKCKFEIGTEEGIRKYEYDDLHKFISFVKDRCKPSAFDNVKYAVVQSGTSVSGISNIGKFDKKRSAMMSAVCHEYGLLAKEHNSDYLDFHQLHARTSCGVDAFNIAPEFGVIETRLLIDTLLNAGASNELNSFIIRCLKSCKWERWLPDDGLLMHNDIKYLTLLCGHYNFATPEYEAAKAKLTENGVDFDKRAKLVIKNRIREIVSV